MSGRSTAAPTWFRDATERFTGLELLFDLIFVFCVSQLTREFRDEPSWSTAGTALLLFVPVWWAWTGVTFATDRFPGDDGVTRALVVVAAAAAGAMALAIPTTPGTGSAAFALGYATIRLVLSTFYWRVRALGPDDGRLARFYSAGFAVMGALWVVSAFVPEPARFVVWGVALLLDFALPQAAARVGPLLPVDRNHLADRCAAFVIIVIGEATVETLTITAEQRLSPVLLATLIAAGAMTVALWWGFFDQGSWRRRYEALGSERSGEVAATVGAYLHFPVVAGIAAAAGGLQLAAEHPDAALGLPASAALSLGCSVFLLSMNAMTRVLRVPRSESLARPRLLVVAGLLILLAVGSTWRPVPYIGAVFLLLAAHDLISDIRTRADRRRS